MRRSMMALFAIAAAGLVNVGGCSPGKDLTKPTLKKEQIHDHAAVGPHKGIVLEWDEYHAEFTRDQGKKEVIVYVFDEKLEKPAPLETETVTLVLTQDKTPLEIPLKASPETGEPKGSASKFVATHDVFGNQTPLRGSIRAKVGDKTYEDEFEEKDQKVEKKK
mgnify:CR=1 FL=1